MIGTGIFAPTAFTNREGMARIKTNPLSIVDGASHAWIADNLPEGKTSQLFDVVGNTHFASNWPTNQSLWPSAVASTGRSTLDFDGGALDVVVALPAVKTVVIVGKFGNAKSGDLILSGGAGATQNIYTGSNGAFALNFGAILAHSKTADVNRHVFIVVQDGANSVFNIDGVEVYGNAGLNSATTLRLGGSSSAFTKSSINQVQVLPYAASASERAGIVARLRAVYGF